MELGCHLVARQMALEHQPGPGCSFRCHRWIPTADRSIKITRFHCFSLPSCRFDPTSRGPWFLPFMVRSGISKTLFFSSFLRVARRGGPVIAQLCCTYSCSVVSGAAPHLGIVGEGVASRELPRADWRGAREKVQENRRRWRAL